MFKQIIKNILYHSYKRQYAFFGKGVKINPTAAIGRKHLISIGNYSFIGKWCHISIVEPATLTIGNYVGISPYVKIIGGDRNLKKVGIHFMCVNDPINKPIVIEDDTMIGMDAMILKGVTIGEGAIVGAKALIMKSILPYTIAVGNPATMVKLRFSPDDIQKHMEAIQSKYDFNYLLELYKKHGLIH